MPIDYLPKAISFLLHADFVGTVNIGGAKISDYELYKKFKPSMQKATYEEITKGLPIKLARDASLNTSLWEELTKGAAELELNH